MRDGREHLTLGALGYDLSVDDLTRVSIEDTFIKFKLTIMAVPS